VKAEHRHPTRLLQPHAIPESKWEVISMDFVVGFPLTTRRHDLIFVVVDTLTKSAHFIPVRITYEVEDIARVFVNDFVRLHGVPRRIISDRGSLYKLIEVPVSISLDLFEGLCTTEFKVFVVTVNQFTIPIEFVWSLRFLNLIMELSIDA
jgi:hypothetical protein